jgi:hypothetical protein
VGDAGEDTPPNGVEGLVWQRSHGQTPDHLLALTKLIEECPAARTACEMILEGGDLVDGEIPFGVECEIVLASIAAHHGLLPLPST